MPRVPIIRSLAVASALSMLLVSGALMAPVLHVGGTTVEARVPTKEHPETELEAIARTKGWTMDQARAYVRTNAALDEMRGEAVAERMAMDRLVEPGGDAGPGDGPLQGAGEDVVPPLPPRHRAARPLPRGEDELPAQLLGGAGVLPLQGVGQLDAGGPAGEVVLVQAAAPLQGRVDGARPHDDAVLVALAAPDQDLAALPVHVLDAEPAALDEAQATKQPDWTHDPEDSGRSPADRIDQTARRP